MIRMRWDLVTIGPLDNIIGVSADSISPDGAHDPKACLPLAVFSSGMRGDRIDDELASASYTTVPPSVVVVTQ